MTRQDQTSDLSPELAQRYGVASPLRRRAVIATAGVVSVAFLAWLAWAAWAQSTPQVTSSLIGWTVTDDHQVVATLNVDVRKGVSGAKCLLRASAVDHSVVGEAYFYVATSGRFSQKVRTERRATAVELVGCTTPDQNRPR